MMTKPKKVKYPENLPLGIEVFKYCKKHGKTITDLAKSIKRSRVVVSNTLNGHYKGENIVILLKKEIEKA